MHFEEVDAGDYRIYAGAIDNPRSFGYVAAVVVVKVRGVVARQEAFRDESLAGGYGWPSPAEALRFAVNAGRDVVMCGVAPRRSPVVTVQSVQLAARGSRG